MQVIPYQPLLLRLLHGSSALLAIGAAISGFLVYDSWDRRFGSLGFTTNDRNLIDLHGTFGFFLFFLFIVFAIYSVTIGRKRLLQLSTAKQLSQFGRPVWWASLQRLTNTTMLIAATLAVASGKLQNENWLPNGELNHPAYFAHLIAWVLVVCCLAIHVLMSAKVGGSPLLASMVSFNVRPDDWLVKQIQRLINSKRT